MNENNYSISPGWLLTSTDRTLERPLWLGTIAVADLATLSSRLPTAVCALSAVSILESARRAKRPTVAPVEERVFRLANDASDDIEFPVWAVMQSGSLAAVFVVSAGLLKLGRVPEAKGAVVAGVGVWAGVKMVKPMIGRGRPEAVLEAVAVRGQRQTGLGYPSGHAAVALTLALAATRTFHPAARAAGIAVASATGIARMYVGAHLPLDVAGGLGIGVLCGRAANALARVAASGV